MTDNQGSSSNNTPTPTPTPATNTTGIEPASATLDNNTMDAIRSLLKEEITNTLATTLKNVLPQTNPLDEFRNQINSQVKSNPTIPTNTKDYINDFKNIKQQEREEVEYYNRKERTFNESKTLLETAAKFGEIGKHLANRIQNDYYSKNIYSDKVNNMFKEDMIRIINEDASLHNLIPKSKATALKEFNEESNPERRLEKASEIFDVVNLVIDLKEQQEQQKEEQLARDRANKTFVNARGDVMRSRFSVENENFFKPKQ